MPRNKRLSNFLRDLAGMLEEEAAKNSEFAARLELLLNSTFGHSAAKNPRAIEQRHSATVPDVLSSLEDRGEEEFRFWLREFDLTTLKAIVKANGFDVARASQKWSDPDKFINLITEQASARLRRGSGFLPPRPSKGDVHDPGDKMNSIKPITVHSFEVYDVQSDQYKRSPRKATVEAIKRINGARAIVGTEEKVDPSRLDDDEMFRPIVPDASARMPAVRDMHPLPESKEAVARGCKCTLARRANGTPIIDQEGKQLYAIERGCPVHD